MIKKLIIGIAVLGVLVGAYFGVNAYIASRPAPEADSTAAYTTENVVNIDSSTVTSVDIRFTDESGDPVYMEFRKSADESADPWTLANYPGVAINQATFGGVLSSITKLNAKEVVADPQPDSAYGLDEPSVAIAVNGKDVLYVGMFEPVSSSYFAKAADSGKVFMLYKHIGDYFQYTIDNYRVGDQYTIISENVGGIRIERSDCVIDLHTASEEEAKHNNYLYSSWIMTSPYSRAGNSDLIQKNIVERIPNIKPTGFVADNATDLSEYGLEPPLYTVTFSYAEPYGAEPGSMELPDPYTMLIGKDDGNGQLYAKLPDDNTVFTLDSDVVSFIDLVPLNYVSSLIFIRDIKTVDNINISGAFRYNLSIEDPAAEEPTFSIDGNVVDPSLFRKAYQAIISFTIYDEVTKPVTAAPELTVTIHYVDGTPSETMVLYPYDDRYYAVEWGGETQFVVRKAQLEELKAAIETAAAQ